MTIKVGLQIKDDFSKAGLCVLIAFLIIHQFSPVSVVPMILFWISMGIINPTSVIASGVSEARADALKQSSKLIFLFLSLSLIALTAFFIIQTIRADIIFHNSSVYEVSDINRSIKLDNEAINLAPWINFYKVRRDFLLKQLGF